MLMGTDACVCTCGCKIYGCVIFATKGVEYPHSNQIKLTI